jgi:hypothetical protein
MRCLKYEALWNIYLDALREWGEIMDVGPPGTYAVRVMQRTLVERDVAREQARLHQRQCLLCTNLWPAREGVTKRKIRRTGGAAIAQPEKPKRAAKRPKELGSRPEGDRSHPGHLLQVQSTLLLTSSVDAARVDRAWAALLR